MRVSAGFLAAALLAVCGCGAGDFTITVQAPSAPVAADGQTPANITLQVLEGGSPIDSMRQGTISFSTDVGSIVPVDVDAGGSPYPMVSDQMAQIAVSGTPVTEPIYSALPGTAHILVRYTDAYSGFAMQRTTVTFK